MGHRIKRERNLDIWTRRLAGERYTELAREYGITPVRARQVFDREERRLREAILRRGPIAKADTPR